MRTTTAVMVAVLAAACGGPAGGPDGGGGGGSSAGGMGGGSAGGGGGGDGGAVCPAAQHTENVTACAAGAFDYQPRKMMPGSNGWPACISDDDSYHPIGMGTPAAVARSIAFGAMAPKLWNNPAPPTPADFLSARDDYSVSAGLASRVARRQDVHYPEVPGGDKFACQNAGVPEQYPDRCTGPARLKPIIDDAFVKGAAGTLPRVQAARIEAALLWFFYLSMTSEVWTCSFNALADCDSAIAYYDELAGRAAPKGLASTVQALGPETHHRVYDAFLAMRCWRHADPALPAVNTTLYDRALAQLSRAGVRAMGLILRRRIGLIGCASGEAQAAAMEFVKVIGALIDHEASLADATRAAQLKAYTSSPSADAGAISGAQAAIDAIFACP